MLLQNEPNFLLSDHGLGNSALPVAQCVCGVFSSSKRTSEAVRRALPDLLRLNRYERRAAARRDRAIRALTQSEHFLQNEPNFCSRLQILTLFFC
jgi:hypothetical protein